MEYSEECEGLIHDLRLVIDAGNNVEERSVFLSCRTAWVVYSTISIIERRVIRRIQEKMIACLQDAKKAIPDDSDLNDRREIDEAILMIESLPDTIPEINASA